jgi:hypothetical protein
MGLAHHLRLRYGASPLHLLAHVAGIAAIAYALSRFLRPETGQLTSLVLWLVGGAVLHDFVLLPLYSAADRALRALLGRGVNYVRVPAAIAGVMLLVYFPLILSKAPAAYQRNTGHEPPDYSARWLTITAVVFAASGVAAAVRHLARRRTLARTPGPPPPPAAPAASASGAARAGDRAPAARPARSDRAK